MTALRPFHEAGRAGLCHTHEVTSTRVPAAPELPGWRHVYSGKVRDIYEPQRSPMMGPRQLLIVATDRVSAFDHILETTIPDKGKVLTAMTMWWFKILARGVDGRPGLPVQDHVLSVDVPDAVLGRALVCRGLDMVPVEAVARGYLTGSGLLEYREHGSVCGVRLPAGLTDGSELDQPIFTPAIKAEVGEHDENVSFDEVAARVGPKLAQQLRDLTLSVYAFTRDVARSRGLVLADTKLEFGRDPQSGELFLADEVLTPDSSRYWAVEDWQPGRPQLSFDKQIVRDWLLSSASGWDRRDDAPPPPLPDEVVERTRARYIDCYQRLTGRRWSLD